MIFSTSLLLADSEPALVEFVPQNGEQNQPVRVQLLFDPNLSNDQTGPTIAWLGKQDKLEVTFKGWNSPLGTALAGPERFGYLGKKGLFMHTAHFKIGSQNLVHLYILLGDTDA